MSPKNPPKFKRTRRFIPISFSVTPEDADRMSEEADACGLSRSEWIRAACEQALARSDQYDRIVRRIDAGTAKADKLAREGKKGRK